MPKFEKKIGRENLTIEVGELAKQADGAVTVRYGGTMVLVTAVMSKKPREGIDFLPLFVEYQEKTYAAGRIPGGFFRREGRPTEKETLTDRLIDRPLRPLFPPELRNEVQIVALVLSSDGAYNPDVLAMIGASCALHISDIPFPHPLGALRIASHEGQLIINPTYQEVAEGAFDLVISAGREEVVMLEAAGKEVSEKDIVEAIKFAQGPLNDIIELQEEVKSACGKEKVEVEFATIGEELLKTVREKALPKIAEVGKAATLERREEIVNAIIKELVEELIDENSSFSADDVTAALRSVEKEYVRDSILKEGKRLDGRGFDDVRAIKCQVEFLPRTHGSGLFTRGETQSLAIVTLGTSSDEQMIESLTDKAFKTFMLHYNFPPFSVGEVRPMRGPGRREIGHGALAEKALRPVMPTKEEFPYTIRVVSEILESNGSSSMATVCAGALALMDAGVPIKRPVAGVALGIVKDKNTSVILTDITGLEDHFGGMDFKITGTEVGITAVQMDVKAEGVGVELIASALEKAKVARLSVLANMKEVISRPREDISTYAPRITVIQVAPEKIKDVIGPGGKVIRKIIADTGVSIDVEDDGSVTVASVDAEASKKALAIIRDITRDAEVGEVFEGKVRRIMPFGAFCEILPGKDGLVHVSELSDKYVGKVEDVVKLGDRLLVKVIEIDQMGRINLSHKQTLPGYEKNRSKGEDKKKTRH